LTFRKGLGKRKGCGLPGGSERSGRWRRRGEKRGTVNTPSLREEGGGLGGGENGFVERIQEAEEGCPFGGGRGKITSFGVLLGDGCSVAVEGGRRERGNFSKGRRNRDAGVR